MHRSVRVLYLAGIGAWLLLVDFILVGALGHRLPRPLGLVGSWILVIVSAALLATVGGLRLASHRERRSRLEAERAQRQVTLLARASEALSTAIDDYEPVVASFVDVVVPDFADWCAVDMVEEGGSRRRLAIRHGDDRTPECSAALLDRFPEFDDLSDQAVGLGRTQQVSRPSQDEAGDGRSAAVAGLVVPIRVRGRTLGLMTFATDSDRDGYQPSDVSAAEQVASRTAITAERVLLYRELQGREARWRALVEATPAVIVEVDLDGRVLASNRYAATMFGWGEEDVAPRAFSPDTAKTLSELWARAAEGEEIIDAQLSVTAARGEHRDLVVSMAPLRAANGVLQGILTLAADVTERRRLQEGLRPPSRWRRWARSPVRGAGRSARLPGQAVQT